MKWVLIVAVFCLAGCSKTITMVYHSNPEGATIYQNGAMLGVTPVSVKYKAPPSFNDGGCTYFSQTMVRWQSGARINMQKIDVCRSSTYLQSFYFNRPNAEGLDYDLQFAQQRAAQQQSVRDDNEQGLDDAAGALGVAIGTLIGRHSH